MQDLSFTALAFQWFKSGEQLDKKVEEILTQFESVEKADLEDDTISGEAWEIDLNEYF